MKLTHLPQVMPITCILAVALLRPPGPLPLGPLLPPAGVITEALNLAGLQPSTCPEHCNLQTTLRYLIRYKSLEQKVMITRVSDGISSLGETNQSRKFILDGINDSSKSWSQFNLARCHASPPPHMLHVTCYMLESISAGFPPRTGTG